MKQPKSNQQQTAQATGRLSPSQVSTRKDNAKVAAKTIPAANMWNKRPCSQVLWASGSSLALICAMPRMAQAIQPVTSFVAASEMGQWA